jgi:hypothetical protein
VQADPGGRRAGSLMAAFHPFLRLARERQLSTHSCH